MKHLLILIGTVAILSNSSVAKTAPVRIDFNLRIPTWADRFNADVVIANTSAATINGWTVEFDLPVAGFSNSWNATEGASTATRKDFTNVSTNGKINAGALCSFGFTAIGPFTVAATNFTFNGLVPAGNIPALSIGDVSAPEGNSTADRVFTVSHSSASSVPVTVVWTTANDGALAGEEHTSASGNLTFAPGETSKSISVSIFVDSVEMSDETFQILLSNPSGAPINNATGISTLINDEFTPGFTISEASTIEGNPGECQLCH